MIKSDRQIVIWLLSGCFLIFLMVIVGGLTRLTHSGLSMVEWHLFMGSIPPMTEQEWQEVFNKYKQYPEYQLINFNFSLEEFKSIFYWEYAHRMLGRLIGLVFVIPFVVFWWRGKINKSLLPKLILIFILGGFQGFLGWYMVKSGLIKNPDVSHYRLAMHLITAFLTFAYVLWVSLGLIYPRKLDAEKKKHPLKSWFVSLLFLLIIQIVWGAFVAGLNAGKVYNTWPMMGEDWIAPSVTAMSPLWLNFVEGIGGVQFIHRYLALILLILVGFVIYKAKKISIGATQKQSLRYLIIAILLQFLLGVFTLLWAVPIGLGLVHQLGAFVLLGVVVFGLHRFRFNSIA